MYYITTVACAYGLNAAFERRSSAAGILILYRLSIPVVGSAKTRREMSRHAPAYDRVWERMGKDAP
jgi:hypothetical protein